MRNIPRHTWFASVMRWIVIILAILSGKISGRSERQESQSERVDVAKHLTSTEGIQLGLDWNPSIPLDVQFGFDGNLQIVPASPYLRQPEAACRAGAQFVSITPEQDGEEFTLEYFKIVQGFSTQQEVDGLVSKALQKYENQPQKLLLIFGHLIKSYPKRIIFYIQYFIYGEGILSLPFRINLINEANLEQAEKLVIFNLITEEIDVPEVRWEIQKLQTNLQKSQEEKLAREWVLWPVFFTIAAIATVLQWIGACYGAAQNRASSTPQQKEPSSHKRSKKKSQSHPRIFRQDVTTTSVQQIATFERETRILERKKELLRKIEEFLRAHLDYFVNPEEVTLTNNFKKAVKNFLLFSDFSKITDIKRTLENDQKNDEELIKLQEEQFENLSAQLCKKRVLVDQYFALDKEFENFNEQYKFSIELYDEWKDEKGNSRAFKYREIVKKYKECKDGKNNVDLIFRRETADKRLLDFNQVKILTSKLKQLEASIAAERLIGKIDVFLGDPEVRRYLNQGKIQNIKENLEELKTKIDTEGGNIKNLEEEYQNQYNIYQKQREEFQVKDPLIHHRKGKKPSSTYKKILQITPTVTQGFQESVSPSSPATSPIPSESVMEIIFPDNVAEWTKEQEQYRKPPQTISIISRDRWREFREIYSKIKLAIQDRQEGHYDSQNCVDNILYFLRCYYHCTRLGVVMINENQQAPMRRHILVHLMKFYPNDAAEEWGTALSIIQRYAEAIINQYAAVFQNQQVFPKTSDFEKQFWAFNKNAYRTRKSLHHLKFGNLLEQDLDAIMEIEASNAVACQIIYALSFIQQILKKNDVSRSDLQRLYPDRVDALKQLLAFLGEQFNYLRDFYDEPFRAWQWNADRIVRALIADLMRFRNEVYHEVVEPQVLDALNLGWEIKDMEEAFVALLSRIPVWEVSIASQNKILDDIQQQNSGLNKNS